MRSIPMLCAALVACADDPASSATDPSETAVPTDVSGPVSTPEPAFGTLTVTIEGREREVWLTRPVGLSTGSLVSLDVDAEHPGNILYLGIQAFDSQAFSVQSYPLGQWGGPLERTDVAMTLTTPDGVTRYETAPKSTTPGSFEITVLDLDEGQISLSWDGTFDARDLQDTLIGTASIQGVGLDLPLQIVQ